MRRIINPLRTRFRSLIGPGGKTPLAQRLDRRAARRVLEALIEKTDDVSTVRWLGRPIWQYPLDAWLIQEMLGELKPDLIVETGTWLGGSTFYYANMLDLLGKGEIISIDIAPRGTMPHPRVTYIQASSTDPTTVAEVAQRIDRTGAKSVLVILDSDHSADYVRNELEAYSPLIPVGGYIHVQDGCIDELHRFAGGRPGPAAAARSFLQDRPQFIRDTEVEFRYLMTAHPYGWLKRIS